MTSLTARKIATGFALLSFAVLAFGSLLNGARIVTSLVRGVEAGLVFGLLAWALSFLLLKEEEDGKEDAESDNNQKGQNLEKVA
ncbi:MAG: hypothetical protein ACE5G9_04685 [Nitrospinales bacterium]